MHPLLVKYLWVLRWRRIGWAYLHASRELRRNERLTHDQMRRLQWDKVTHFLDHAYNHVPFYRKRFDDAGLHPSKVREPDDLRRLPVLTRQDLQTHLEDMVADNFDRASLLRNQTGGSTGNPVIFYETYEFKARLKAILARSRGWAGFADGQKIGIIWGADRDIPTLNPIRRFRIHHVENQRWLNSYNMTDKSMEDFAHLLLRWRPRYILAYAAAAYLFAKFLRERGLDRIRPVAIETSAEKLQDYQRELIEDVFRCKVFDCYGSRDVPGVAFECEQHRGLHVLSDNVYVEVLRDGQPAQPGEIGEIIVTKFTCPAMPLIRYQIGDLTRPSKEVCPCGRPFPLLEEIVGKSNDLLTTPEGKHVHSAFFNRLFYGLEGIKQIQVYQKTVYDVTISIIAPAGLSDETLERLKDKIVNQMGHGVDVQLKLVDHIPPTATGKHRYMISEVGPSFITRPSA